MLTLKTGNVHSRVGGVRNDRPCNSFGLLSRDAAECVDDGGGYEEDASEVREEGEPGTPG